MNELQHSIDSQFKYLWVGVKYLFTALLLSPIIITSFILSNYLAKINDLGRSGMLIIVFTIIFSYLIYSFIFFLKGVLIALKSNRRKIWIVIFIFVVSFTCLLPFGITYYNVGVFSKVANSEKETNIWSITLAIIVGIFAYRKYDFLTDVAPKSVFWAYKIGFDIVRNNINNPNDDVADISATDIV